MNSLKEWVVGHVKDAVNVGVKASIGALAVQVATQGFDVFSWQADEHALIAAGTAGVIAIAHYIGPLFSNFGK